MALKLQDLQKLMYTVAKASRKEPVKYNLSGSSDVVLTYDALQDTLRKELRELAGTYQLYRENQNTIFTLIENTIDDILPKRVMEQYAQFAEIKIFNQGDKPVFVQRITTAAKRRALQFITKVGLAGIYEVFKLDKQNYEIPTSAYGGAAQIGFEEFLDGTVDFSDVLDIIMEGLDRAIYIEIERALKAGVSQLPPANRVSENTFVETEMDKLISIADSYGGKSTVYCTFEFAATMIPSEGWVSDSMKDEKWNNGYLGTYKNHKVVVLQQSYEDETNTTKVIDPSFAWIIPDGTTKPVKIAFEGSTIVKEYENKDLSREVQVYKKVGVGAIMTNNICVYQNTSLTVTD